MADPRLQGFRAQQQVIKLRYDDYTFQRQNDPLVSQVNSAAQNPLLNSTPVERVSFTVQPAVAPGNDLSNTVRVRHGLGREFRGWTTTCITRGDVKIFEDPNNSKKSTEVLLKAKLDEPLVDGTDSAVTLEINILVF